MTSMSKVPSLFGEKASFSWWVMRLWDKLHVAFEAREVSWGCNRVCPSPYLHSIFLRLTLNPLKLPPSRLFLFRWVLQWEGRWFLPNLPYRHHCNNQYRFQWWGQSVRLFVYSILWDGCLSSILSWVFLVGYWAGIDVFSWRPKLPLWAWGMSIRFWSTTSLSILFERCSTCFLFIARAGWGCGEWGEATSCVVPIWRYRKETHRVRIWKNCLLDHCLPAAVAVVRNRCR